MNIYVNCNACKDGNGTKESPFRFINDAAQVAAAEINDEHDNPPIGIILCTDKDSVAAEYALGGLSNNIFASRYVSYIPNKEQLVAQVEAVLNEWNKPE